MRGLLPDAVLDEQRRGFQAADWHVGFDAARPEIQNEVARLARSPIANRCLNLPRMQSLVKDWPTHRWHDAATRTTYLQAFSRALAAGHFIRRIEDNNS